MVEFNQNLDRNSKLYIPKPMRRAGFNGTIVIRPNDNAAVMYPAGAHLTDVKASVEVILMDIENILRKTRKRRGLSP